MKKYIIGAAVCVVAILLVTQKDKDLKNEVMPSGVDPANTTYLIEGERVLLTDGVFETPSAPNSSSTIRTAIFGQQVLGDLDADTDMDMVLLLERDMAGSGTFYYLAVALQNPDKTAQGLNAILVGDRIAPQTMEIRDGVVIFNYAERRPSEPMSTQPSMGVSLYAEVKNGELVRAQPVQ